jgi:hypothetical protein
MTDRVVQFSETSQDRLLTAHSSARAHGRDVVSLSSKEDNVSASDSGSEHPVNSGPNLYRWSFGSGVKSERNQLDW